MAKVRILDPPTINEYDDPFKYKLLARLYFYWREISVISKSPFLQALINRISDISYVSDYQSLDGKPLLNLAGGMIKTPISYTLSKTILPNQEAFGEVFRIDKDTFFFYGFDMKIVDLLISQNFTDIIEFKSDLQQKSHEVNIITARIKKEDAENSQYLANKNRYKIKMSGRLSANSAGRIFGKLTVS